MGEEENLESLGTEPEQHGPGPNADEAGDEARVEKGMTPGQRLAAKKAAKASKKREFKEDLKQQEREADAKARAEAGLISSDGSEPALPQEVEKVARDFSDFAHDNRKGIMTGILAIVAISVIAVLAQRVMNSGAAEAAAALGAAVDIATAPIDEENQDGKGEDGKPVFASREARAKKAAESYGEVAKKFADQDVAPWARLGEAAQLMMAGDYPKAVVLYQAVYDGQPKDPSLRGQALEGLGIALETTGKADDALKRFEELGTVGSGEFKDVSEYHVARMKLAAGDDEAAKTLLKGVYDRLTSAPEGTPPSKYLRGEVEQRLAELDSSLVDKGTAGSGDQQFSQEQIQKLLEQLKLQGGGVPGGAQ